MQFIYPLLFYCVACAFLARRVQLASERLSSSEFSGSQAPPQASDATARQYSLANLSQSSLQAWTNSAFNSFKAFASPIRSLSPSSSSLQLSNPTFSSKGSSLDHRVLAGVHDHQPAKFSPTLQSNAQQQGQFRPQSSGAGAHDQPSEVLKDRSRTLRPESSDLGGKHKVFDTQKQSKGQQEGIRSREGRRQTAGGVFSSLLGLTWSWRLKVLTLFLALSGSVPALAFIRERRSAANQQRLIGQNNGVDSRKRAPAPVLSAAHTPASTVGTMTVSSSIINLTKNIVGSGVLALASGVAAFSSSPAGVVPAVLALVCLGFISGYSFTLIARVGEEVGATSYRTMWAKLFGEATAIIPALTVVFKTFVGGFGFSIILGDSFASVASMAGLPPILCASNTWILGLSGFLLLPLSLMRNLSALAFGSAIGIAGMLYTAFFVWLRFFDHSYTMGGKFHALLAESAQPLFAAHTAARPLFNSSIFVLISMISTAYLAHFNAPKFYQELAPPADGGSKGMAFNKVVAGGFGLAVALCATIMAGGYLTFGGASQGLILNSYATSDPLAFLARLGICASIIFSYPLNFVGVREGALSLLKLDGSKASVHIISTVLLLCAMNGLSLVIKNLGFVVAVAGAALGSALVYTFPAMMFIQSTRLKRRELEAKGEQLPASRVKEMYANYGLVGLGLSLAVIGVKIVLKSAA